VRTKPVLVTFVAVVAILLGGLAVYRWQASKRPELCQMCGRDIPKQTAFRIETAHGTLFACCPRCALHHVINHPGEARKELATDFNSGRLISAQSAYYDEGGDVQYCTVHESPVERTPMGVQVRTYDRCLPTLVAFANRNEAEAYREEHGGRVVTYNQALEDTAGKQN
jgi:hypothetical protein